MYKQNQTINTILIDIIDFIEKKLSDDQCRNIGLEIIISSDFIVDTFDNSYKIELIKSEYDLNELGIRLKKIDTDKNLYYDFPCSSSDDDIFLNYEYFVKMCIIIKDEIDFYFLKNSPLYYVVERVYSDSNGIIRFVIDIQNMKNFNS